MIHDNGLRPFKVLVTKDDIKIYTYKNDHTDPDYNILLLRFKKFIGYWYGFDINYNYHGNSILIQITKSQYVFVGWVIQSFETSEEIYDYVSPIGNSDVHYPIAYSENYVYFMLENKYVKKEIMITDAKPINANEIYHEFYDSKNIGIKFKKLKTLVKRLF